MRYGDEGVQALEWAYGRLSGSQALADALSVAVGALPGHLWNDGDAPSDAPDLIVVLAASDPLDAGLLGDAPRLWSRVPLTVRGVFRGTDYGALAPVSRAIYGELHGRRNDPIPGGGTMLTCLRTSSVQYPEDAGGIQYRHLGQRFQVEID